jgi:CheY-like chemotaxis protein
MREIKQVKEIVFNDVLLIDDNEIDNFIASSIIGKLGMAKNIISKNSAEEALAYLAECLENNSSFPEIIFLDIRMPSMDGFGFLREFAKFPPTVHFACNIFILSSSVDSRDIERAKKNSFVSGFITKPLTFSNLEKAVSLLPSRQQNSYSGSE